MHINDYLRVKQLRASVKAKATGLVTKTFTVEAKPDVMETFEKFLAYVQWCCGVGHSTHISMFVDGDGSDAFYVKEKLPKVKEEDVVHADLQDAERLR